MIRLDWVILILCLTLVISGSLLDRLFGRRRSQDQDKVVRSLSSASRRLNALSPSYQDVQEEIRREEEEDRLRGRR